MVLTLPDIDNFLFKKIGLLDELKVVASRGLQVHTSTKIYLSRSNQLQLEHIIFVSEHTAILLSNLS